MYTTLLWFCRCTPTKMIGLVTTRKHYVMHACTSLSSLTPEWRQGIWLHYISQQSSSNSKLLPMLEGLNGIKGFAWTKKLLCYVSRFYCLLNVKVSVCRNCQPICRNCILSKRHHDIAFVDLMKRVCNCSELYCTSGIQHSAELKKWKYFIRFILKHEAANFISVLCISILVPLICNGREITINI